MTALETRFLHAWKVCDSRVVLVMKTFNLSDVSNNDFWTGIEAQYNGKPTPSSGK